MTEQYSPPPDWVDHPGPGPRRNAANLNIGSKNQRVHERRLNEFGDGTDPQKGTGLIRYLSSATGAVARWLRDKLEESVSVLDFIPESEHAAIKDGTSTTNLSSYVGTAINALLARGGGGKLLFPFGPGAVYTLNTQIVRTLSGNHCIAIEGEGATIRTNTDAVLDFWAAQVATTTLEAKATEGSRSLTVASTTGMQKGDVIVAEVPLIAETTWHRDMMETHIISRVVNSTTVEIGNPLNFRFYPQLDVIWTGTGSRTAFWYPSYFVPTGQIQVLLDGAVQGSGYTIAARNADAQGRFGYDITFSSAPGNGVEVRVRNTQKVAIKVFRGGRLSIEGLRFSSTDGVRYMRASYLRSPHFANLLMESDNAGAVGDYLYWRQCVTPTARNISTVHGRYAIHVLGCRDADIEGVRGYDGWHPVSVSSFSDNTNVRRVWGYRNHATVDSHPAFNLHMKDCFGLDDDVGIENRGVGGSMENVHTSGKSSSGAASFTNGMVWQTDGDLESPYTYLPYKHDFHVTRSSFRAPNATGGFYVYTNQLNRVVFDDVYIDGSIGTWGSFVNLGINELVVRNSEVGRILPRRVNRRAYIQGGKVGQIVFGPSSAVNPTLDAFGTTFSHSTAIISGVDPATGLGRRRFFGCRFESAANFSDGTLGTGTNRKKYDFFGCTFDAVLAFDANIAINGGVFRDCEFLNGSPTQATDSEEVNTLEAFRTADVYTLHRMYAANNLTAVSGTVHLFRGMAVKSGTYTKVRFYTPTAFSSMTDCRVGVYDASGNKLAESGNIGAALANAVHEVSLTASVSLTKRDTVWLAFAPVGGTMGTIRSANLGSPLAVVDPRLVATQTGYTGGSLPSTVGLTTGAIIASAWMELLP